MADTSSSKKLTKQEKLQKMIEKYPDTHEIEVIKKPWHRLAVIRSWMGYTHEEIAGEVNKAKGTITSLMRSPGARAMKTELEVRFGDPAELAKLMAKAATFNVTTDWYMALEWAKSARDYKAVAAMTKDLAALGGVQATPPKQEFETTKTIRIVMDSDSLDSETVEADWEELLDEDDDT